MYFRSGGVDPGRDGCRVPLPWAGTDRPFGFSPAGASSEPWLRQPAGWADRTVKSQHDDPASMLNLYRSALRIRRSEPDLGDGPMRWLAAPDDVLAFARGERFVSVTNLSTGPIVLPVAGEVLLASAELDDGRLPADASAWIRVQEEDLARSPGFRQREAG
jgi:alpha-glucosidase